MPRPSPSDRYHCAPALMHMMHEHPRSQLSSNYEASHLLENWDPDTLIRFYLLQYCSNTGILIPSISKAFE